MREREIVPGQLLVLKETDVRLGAFQALKITDDDIEEMDMNIGDAIFVLTGPYYLVKYEIEVVDALWNELVVSIFHSQLISLYD